MSSYTPGHAMKDIADANQLENLEDLDDVPQEEAPVLLGHEVGAGPEVQLPEGDRSHPTMEGEQVTVQGGGEAVLEL